MIFLSYQILVAQYIAAEEGSLAEHFEGKISNRFLDGPHSSRHIRCMFYHSNNQPFVHHKAIKKKLKKVFIF